MGLESGAAWLGASASGLSLHRTTIKMLDGETEVQRLSNFPQNMASKWYLPYRNVMWVSGIRSRPGWGAGVGHFFSSKGNSYSSPWSRGSLKLLDFTVVLRRQESAFPNYSEVSTEERRNLQSCLMIHSYEPSKLVDRKGRHFFSLAPSPVVPPAAIREVQCCLATVGR